MATAGSHFCSSALCPIPLSPLAGLAPLLSWTASLSCLCCSLACLVTSSLFTLIHAHFLLCCAPVQSSQLNRAPLSVYMLLSICLVYHYMFRYTYNGYIHHCSSVLPPDHHTVHHCPVGGVWGISLKED